MKIDCRKLIEKNICAADCCGVVPIPKQTVKQFEHLKQREVEKKDILSVEEFKTLINFNREITF